MATYTQIRDVVRMHGSYPGFGSLLGLSSPEIDGFPGGLVPCLRTKHRYGLGKGNIAVLN